MKDYTCHCIGNEERNDHALWCPALGHTNFMLKNMNNETPDPNYTPKKIVPYTDKELENLRQCDCDDATYKWELTIRRLRDEFNTALKYWMDNVRPLTLKEAEETFNMQLVAISVASRMNTESSNKDRINRNNSNWTIALDDVYKAMDREIVLIKENEELNQKIGRAKFSLE